MNTTGVGDAFGSSFAAGMKLYQGDIAKSLLLGAKIQQQWLVEKVLNRGYYISSMPELPEVETIARDLHTHLKGQIVKNITIIGSDSFLHSPISEVQRAIVKIKLSGFFDGQRCW